MKDSALDTTVLIWGGMWKSVPRWIPAILLGLAGVVRSTTGGEPVTAAGHWEGSISLPSTALEVRVDLKGASSGKWQGTIDIPVQSLRGFKLEPVTVDATSVTFQMPGIPGEPRFEGKLSADGGLLSGTFSQSGQDFPFRLERKAKQVESGETPSAGVPGKGLAGYWQGSLKPTPVIELRLALELTNKPSGSPGGVMISLDQGSARIPITDLSETNSHVRLKTASVGGSFEGSLNPDGSELSGKWNQGGQSMPLVFKRLAAPVRLNRPQEPTKPYPYRDEEVTIPSTGATLAGTLTIPRGTGPFPAVVLITGSGPQDRDEAVMSHRPFLVLADHLTRRGIAVLRCDDRGIAKSSGNFANATEDDFVTDTLAAFDWLRKRPEVDPRLVGLVGHSEGGIIAPLAALKRTEVAFVVMLAGVGVPIEDLLMRQSRDIALLMGAGEDLVARNEAVQRRVLQIAKTEPDRKTAEDAIRAAIKEQADSLTPQQRDALGLSNSAIEAQVKAAASPWTRSFLKYDAWETLKALKCPVLAINGEKDIQVAAKENLARIRQALEAGGNKQFRTVELPGLNHLFQACKTGAVSEYSTIEETMNPVALNLISDWILKAGR